MKIFSIFAFLLFFATFQTPAFAQHPVLFETFTNTCDPCPDGLRPTFDQAVSSVLSSEGSKIIYLNYHIGNFCDPMAQPSSPYTDPVDQRLTGNSSQLTAYVGAVNRTDFGSGHASGTGTDWAGEIEQASASTPPATITLQSASLDKTSSGLSYTLRATVTVTATQSIPDNINIFFAVVGDGINLPSTTNGICQKNPGAEPLGPYNSIVWYITGGTGISVFSGGASSGKTKQISFTEALANPHQDPLFDWTKMRLIAFIEESSNATDYRVVNAADLRDDLDTLQPPPPTLSFGYLSSANDTLAPGTDVQVNYSSSNLPSGANAFYSLDNGTTWRLIGDSLQSGFTWHVPDSLTTQGKIKLVASSDPTIVSIESGNFVIAYAPFISFVYPQNGSKLKADTTLTIQWRKLGVGAVKVQYSIATSNGAFGLPWFPIASSVTDTFVTWAVPDTNAIAEIQLVPIKNEAPAASSIDTIRKLFQQSSVGPVVNASALQFTGAFPNPAMNGEEIELPYHADRPFEVEVVDLLGHSVGATYHFDTQAVHLDTRSLSAGAYIVRMSDGVHSASERVEVVR